MISYFYTFPSDAMDQLGLVFVLSLSEISLKDLSKEISSQDWCYSLFSAVAVYTHPLIPDPVAN